MIRVTVWNEFYHEKNDPRTAAVYPDGLHMAIKRMLECEDVTVRTATLDDPECGLTEEVLAAIRGHQQDDAAYERRKFRHKAYYSLNREDGIENDALNRPLTPAEVLEQKLLREEVYAALMQLTDIQARRIYARFYLGMTVAEIARIEGADRRRVWESIRRGLKKLARLLDTAK